MTIRFTCPNRQCNQSIGAPESLVGKKAQCPFCGLIVTVPQIPQRQPHMDLDALSRLAQGEVVDERHTKSPSASPPPPRPAEPPDKPIESCPTCGTVHQAGRACPYCRGRLLEHWWRLIPFGKILAVLIILAALAAMGFGVMWVIKNLAHTGGTYVETLTNVQQGAKETRCLQQLKTLYSDLQLYSAMHGRLPDRLEDLQRPDLIRCPLSNGPAYQYIAGQNDRMPGSNVLVYESVGFHGGLDGLLRLDGTVELLPSEQVARQVDQTHRQLSRR